VSIQIGPEGARKGYLADRTTTELSALLPVCVSLCCREPGDQTYETNGVVDGPFSVPYPIYEVTSSALTHTWVGNVDEQTGTVVDEAGPNRLNPLVHVNNFAMVEFDWERNEVTMSLNKAEKTQLQRHADNGSVLQTVTIQLSELVGEGW